MLNLLEGNNIFQTKYYDVTLSIIIIIVNFKIISMINKCQILMTFELFNIKIFIFIELIKVIFFF